MGLCYHVKVLPGEFWFGTTFLCSKSTGTGMQALNSSVVITNNNISHARFDLAGGILIIQTVCRGVKVRHPRIQSGL